MANTNNAGALELETTNLAGALRVARWGIAAGRVIHWIGHPGIGKSAIAMQLAGALGFSLETLIASQSAPEDLGGIPVPREGLIERLPIGPIRRASAGPALLFLDEVSQAPAYLQGAMLTLINERFCGDARLHAETGILLASNPEISSAGGQAITAPFANRVHSINVVPDHAEVIAYLGDLGPSGSTLRELGADYAATLERSPDLLQLTPPADAQSGAPWASPRAIERALRIWASAIDSGESPDDLGVAKLALGGSIGGNASRAFLAILKIRDQVASPAEITRDPKGAKVPTNTDAGIATLGVVARVAESACASAWVYAERLAPEWRATLIPRLLKGTIDPKSPHAGEASKSRIKIMGAHGAAIARAGAGVRA